MSVLGELVDGAVADAREREATTDLATLRQRADAAPAPLDPMPAFRDETLSVIAEVKRRSPSRGDLAPITDPAALAAKYAEGGAHAISVLTERHRFGGDLDDLRAVRERVQIPVLRKDFLVTEYQVVEARAFGADLALLIVAALEGDRLDALYRCALDLGLTPLVEVHNEEELERANALEAELIGINNRNLKNLEVDPTTFTRLVRSVRPGAVRVAESGIRTPGDARGAEDAGAHVVLVGEGLVTQKDPRAAVRALIG